MATYYNEYDPFAAAWLRELIKAGLIAPGDVDERSIEDVLPSEIAGYTQCHFFAGIGGWSYALRLAGWPDDRPVWTGSCPCQPFSAVGKGAGTADERHLWPAWFHLIEQCQPSVVLGEQVDAAIRHGWLDLVQADLEGIGYAFGAVGLPAACVGAPHIRQRLWFVAESLRAASEWGSGGVSGTQAQVRGPRQFNGNRADGLTDGSENGSGKLVQPGGTRSPPRIPEQAQREARVAGIADDASRERLGAGFRPSATAGFWHPADWLPCRDGKARPVEPGTFPLAHGVPARVGRLRGYGNAIVPQVAAEFIKAYLDTNA